MEFIHNIVITGDGSPTLYVPGMDETFHSVNGAIAESRHVFAGNGWSFLRAKAVVNVLEVGFGTGLNTLLTALAASGGDMSVNYWAVEKYPLPLSVIERLQYPQFLDPGAGEVYRAIHAAPWQCATKIHGQFTLVKTESDFLTFNELSPDRYDLVYFDAFCPDKQPEMWTQEVFNRLYASMSSGGIIVTYSAKGAVRRRMTSAGFTMERLPGPPGKREMLRGRKK